MSQRPSAEALSKITEIEDFLSNVETTFVSLFPSCQALQGLPDHEYIEAAQLLHVQHKNTLSEVDRWSSHTFLGDLKEELAEMLDALERIIGRTMPNNADSSTLLRHHSQSLFLKLVNIHHLVYPWVHTASWRLQWLMRRLVADESAETKKRMYNKFAHLIDNPVDQHVGSKPEISVESRLGHLPLEMMGCIYNFCSLETSVALRQVSSAWYSAYTIFDSVLQDLLLDRTLGLRPGEYCSELSTWGDCVLVFVARLNNPLWQASNPEQGWADFGPGVEEEHGVVAQPVSGKLPADLQLMSKGWKSDSYSLDFTTLTFYREYQVVFEAIEEVDEDMHAHFSDFTLILPPYMHTIDQVHWNKEAIMVICHDTETAYTLPWHSLDYRQELGFEVSFNEFLNRAYCHSPDSPIVLRNTPTLPSVLDISRKCFVLLAEEFNMSDQVVSNFNGLYWGIIGVNRALVPFFIDYKETDTAHWYFRKDWAMHVEGEHLGSDNQRFVCCEDETFDLATRCGFQVVSDENETKEPHTHIVGFSEGKLKAWSYLNAELEQYEKELEAMKRENPGQDKYDVSGLVPEV